MVRPLSILLTLLIVVPAVAQQTAPVPGETIEVQVTNLDVVVTDSRGARVRGLTQGDFEVLQDGKPVPISNFSAIARGDAAATEAVHTVPRRILIVIDNGSIALAARRKIFDATRKTIDELLIGPSDRIAIATISRSVQQRLGWTSDRVEIAKAIDAVERDAILPRADLAELERALEAIRRDADSASASMGPGTPQITLDESGNVISVPGSSSGGTGRGKSQPPVAFQQVVTRGRNYALNLSNESKQTLSALNAALSAFAAVPGGRKLVILAGGALPLNAGDAVFQRIESLRNELELSGHRGFTGVARSNPLGQNPAFDVTPVIDRVAANARMKGVAIYSVNPEFGQKQTGGVQSTTHSDNVGEFAAAASALNGYQRLSSGTGGLAMIGAPAEQALTEIRNDLDSYYSLGYRSSGALDAKTQISVKVKNGHKARAAIATAPVDREWEVSDQVVAYHTLEPANPLGIELAADPVVVKGTTRTVPIKVVIPVDSLTLTKEGAEYLAAFSVYVSIGDKDGGASEPIRQEQKFRWTEETVAQVKGKKIGFAVNVDVEAGRDRISIGVLDQNSGNAGFARMTL